MERQSFVFYKDWRDVIKDLPNDVRLEVYDSIIEYALTGKLPKLKPMANIAFNFIKPQIDRNNERYKNGCKGAEHGFKGGRPPKEKPQNNPTKTPNDNVNDNDIKKENIKEKAVRFSPPPFEEVKAYCLERQNNVDPQKFNDFYESKGWMIGKNKMKDWKAAVRTWEKEEKQKGGTNESTINRLHPALQ